MNDALGTLLYVLLMILAIGASVYKSSAKKKASAGNRTTKSPFFDFDKEVDYSIPDTMSMYIPGGTQVNRDAELETEQNVVLEAEEDIEKEEIKEEGQAVFEKTKATLISENPEMMAEISTTEILNEKGIYSGEADNTMKEYHFNLKRAVIFSEILNRKEF